LFVGWVVGYVNIKYNDGTDLFLYDRDLEWKKEGGGIDWFL
jgi:hypothetical protein